MKLEDQWMRSLVLKGRDDGRVESPLRVAGSHQTNLRQVLTGDWQRCLEFTDEVSGGVPALC